MNTFLALLINLYRIDEGKNKFMSGREGLCLRWLLQMLGIMPTFVVLFK